MVDNVVDKGVHRIRHWLGYAGVFPIAVFLVTASACVGEEAAAPVPTDSACFQSCRSPNCCPCRNAHADAFAHAHEKTCADSRTHADPDTHRRTDTDSHHNAHAAAYTHARTHVHTCAHAITDPDTASHHDAHSTS